MNVGPCRGMAKCGMYAQGLSKYQPWMEYPVRVSVSQSATSYSPMCGSGSHAGHAAAWPYRRCNAKSPVEIDEAFFIMLLR
jgi:hypothetical protein